MLGLSALSRREQDALQHLVGVTQEGHVFTLLIHLSNILPQHIQSEPVWAAPGHFQKGSLEEVHISVDLLLLPLVEALALLASLVRHALGDVGEELGHEGEVPAGLPVLPADLAERELGGVVEGKKEKSLSVLVPEPPLWVEGLLVPMGLADGLAGGTFRRGLEGSGLVFFLDGNGREVLLFLEDGLLFVQGRGRSGH